MIDSHRHARAIQQAIFRKKVSGYRLLLPNYTPLGWFECDLFAVTKAGLFHEFEIKLSIADFRRDAEKRSCVAYREITDPVLRTKLKLYDGRLKYDRLADADPIGPAQFWYVVPVGLLPIDSIPPFAGLIEVWNRQDGSWVMTKIAKQAPRLHRTKVSSTIEQHALRATYWRFWQERQLVNAGR